MSSIGLPPIIGESPAMRRAISLVERFAPTHLPILLVGATGTGKELFARHIHERSGRTGELVDINCGALPYDMVESLLFGHRRGAFTGAVESVTGHVERATHGTLFLDEVLHLPATAQVKLLRVLETGEVQPLGETRKRPTDLRVVAAAQDDTADLLSAGNFRRDLYQRLAGVVITLPTLAERAEDILPLSKYFAEQQHQVLEAEAVEVLKRYSWPGNIRELRLTINRAGCLVENGTLPAAAIAEAIEMGVPEAACTRQKKDLIELMEAHDWDIRRAAATIGIGRSTLYDRLRAAGLSPRSLNRERWRNSNVIRTTMRGADPMI